MSIRCIREIKHNTWKQVRYSTVSTTALRHQLTRHIAIPLNGRLVSIISLFQDFVHINIFVDLNKER